MAVNIEDFLKSKGFTLETYYGTNKKYWYQINDCQNLYVRIFSDVNKLVEVEYENVAQTQFETTAKVSFETIDTFEKLEKLISAFV